ncbi:MULTISPECIES: hypothetical protein [unclassified Pseudomonas]|uniref:hypothetical protein n=1 Tax=unclassified Pseudomonas TaxID=196821 RepID=UPI000DA8336B|nr:MULTISPECIES: hypothetical protein [unclassified Pseudomonas]MDW3711401.1 hypothetical protein [Pseudomonas sp. 2023EL-01195]PZE12838.1 hypothetical protein DMX10_13620 [Pseudomonas sp. 57B-090624]
MNDEQDLHRHLAAQPQPTPPAGLAARIVAHATAQPQRQGWRRQLAKALENWGYGWQVKLASVALCGVLGLLAGHFTGPGPDDDLVLAAQAVDQLLWTEEP